jgi:hypothetical protein
MNSVIDVEGASSGEGYRLVGPHAEGERALGKTQQEVFDLLLLRELVEESLRERERGSAHDI